MCHNFKIFMQEDNFLNFKNMKMKENQYSNSSNNVIEKVKNKDNDFHNDEDENDLMISKKKNTYYINND